VNPNLKEKKKDKLTSSESEKIQTLKRKKSGSKEGKQSMTACSEESETSGSA